jgi:GTPase SAR1 family protein
MRIFKLKKYLFIYYLIKNYFHFFLKMEEEQIDKIDYEILSDDYPKYDHSFKIIIIGDSGVGKSCLSVKATKNIFESSYLATVGFEFFNFNLRLGEKIIRLQIWDTCGQEIYRSLITNFYRNSALAFLVFAVDE